MQFIHARRFLATIVATGLLLGPPASALAAFPFDFDARTNVGASADALARARARIRLIQSIHDFDEVDSGTSSASSSSTSSSSVSSQTSSGSSTSSSSSVSSSSTSSSSSGNNSQNPMNSMLAFGHLISDFHREVNMLRRNVQRTLLEQRGHLADLSADAQMNLFLQIRTLVHNALVDLETKINAAITAAVGG